MRTEWTHWRDVAPHEWHWPDFSPQEMACRGTGRLKIHPASMDKLQLLRKTLARPMIVNSAYRSPEHNKRVGGAPNSNHMAGIAFDVRMANHDPAAFERAARAVGFKGFGYYPKQGFMHIDTGAARTWGEPFPKRLATPSFESEPAADRTNPVQSKTVQASAVQVASGAGAGIAAVGALDGTAQIVALIFAGVVVLAGMWILRDRLRDWTRGDR